MFPAIQYNDKKFSVEIAICVLLALSFFPIKSLILTVDWYYSNKEKGNKLNMFKENVLKMPRKWKLNQTDTEYNSNLSYSKRTVTESIGKFIGFVLVFFYEWFNAQYSYSKAKVYIYDSDIIGIILAILVVFTTFYLTGLVVIRLTSMVFELFF